MVIATKLALKLFVVFILAKEIYDNRNKTKFTFLKIEIETMMMEKRICHYKSVCSETRDEFLPKFCSENVFTQTCNQVIVFQMSCCVLKTIYKMISNYPSFILVVNR